MSKFQSFIIDKIKSLHSDDELLEAILDYPPLIRKDSLKEKLEDLSMRMEAWVEKEEEGEWENGKENETEKLTRSREFKIMFIVHICPELLRSKEFSWLSRGLCDTVRDIHFSGTASKKYWGILAEVKRQFYKTKRPNPELPWQIFSSFMDARKAIREEGRKRRIDLLKVLYRARKKINYGYFIDLLKGRISEGIVRREIGRVISTIKRYAKEKKTSPEDAIEKYSEEITELILDDKQSDKRFARWLEKKITIEAKDIDHMAKQRVIVKHEIGRRTIDRHLNRMNKLWQTPPLK